MYYVTGVTITVSYVELNAKSGVTTMYHLIEKKPEDEEEEQKIIPVITHYDEFHSRLNRRWAQLIRANSVFNEARIISAYRRQES